MVGENRPPSALVHQVAAQRVQQSGTLDFGAKHYSVSGEMPKFSGEGVQRPNFGATSAGAKSPLTGMVNEGINSMGAGGDYAKSYLSWGGQR